MSFGRTLSLSAALSAIAATSVPAQALAGYSPGARRYHLIAVNTRSADQDGQHSEFKITNEQLLTVKIVARTKDTLDFSYTMDSSSIVMDPPQDIPDISGMKGTEVHGAMSPFGKVYSFASAVDTNDVDRQQLGAGMSKFLVALPPDAHVGSTWVDTTNKNTDNNGDRLDQRTITTSTILADTTYDGERAWRVRRRDDLSIAGTQSSLGSHHTLEGHGAGEAVYYISRSGVFLGSVGKQTTQAKITEKETGKTASETIAGTSKIELVH